MSTMKKSVATAVWERKNSVQVISERFGAVSMPWLVRICHTVEDARLWPSPASSPWECGGDRAEQGPVVVVDRGPLDLAAQHGQLVASTMISRSFERLERTARRARGVRNR